MDSGNDVSDGSDNYDSRSDNRHLYDIIREILYERPVYEVPQVLFPLIGSRDFSQVKEWFDHHKQEEIRFQSPILINLDIIPTTAALMFLVQVDPIVEYVLEGAPDYDVIKYVLPSNKQSLAGKDSRRSRCEEIYSNATSDLPLDVMKQIVLHTKGLRQLEKLYQSSPVFACILDDVDVLKVLKDRAINSGRDIGTSLAGVGIGSFDGYVQFIKDNFVNYTTIPIDTEDVDNSADYAIEDDDLEWYLTVESLPRYYHNSYTAEAIAILDTEIILEYMLDTKPITLTCLCVMILLTRYDDVVEIYGALDKTRYPEGVVSANMLYSLCYLDVPHEDIKEVVMDAITVNDDLTVEFLNKIPRYITGTNTRWMAKSLTNIVDSVGIRTRKGIEIETYVLLGLLRLLANSLVSGGLNSYSAHVDRIMLSDVPDDVSITELKFFISVLLNHFTDSNIQDISDRVKAVLNECIDEYHDSSLGDTKLWIERQQ